jgi:transcriptional regulator with XRE-family HTH domain
MARRSNSFSQEKLDCVAARITSLMRANESMNAFCRRCGDIDSGNMSRYMGAKTMPTLEILMSIADATGVTLDWLAAGREPKYRADVRPAVSVAAHGKHGIAAGGNVMVVTTKGKRDAT